MRYLALLLITTALALSTACGGGGKAATSTTSTSTQATAALTIVTSTIPDTIQGHAYSTTLTATGGSGTLHWSMSPQSTVTPLPTGLSLDASTGILSGTSNFGGVAGFIAQVTDSSSPPLSTTRAFGLTSFAPLKAGPVEPISLVQYQSSLGIGVLGGGVQGGVFPYRVSISGGSLPPGVRLTAGGSLIGGPYTTGAFQATVTVQDSFSPPETVSLPVTITVTPPSLQIASAFPNKLILNRPFSWTPVTLGGTKPYTYKIVQNFLPPGVNPIDPATGTLTGVPTVSGSAYGFGLSVSDSSVPAQTSNVGYSFTVGQPLGRNDTPATATRVFSFAAASISPYIDPPNGAPTAADGDYYKVMAVPGAVVHAQAFARVFNPDNPLDTVMEIVDVNGTRLNLCRLPGDTSNNFTSLCLNDDISSSPVHLTDSALDLQVPANATPALTFLVHIIDWRGDARPDMTYNLQVIGAVDPLVILDESANVLKGVPSTLITDRIGGLPPVTYSLASGSLPPGFNLNANGLLSGTPTTNGTYSFSLMATDAISQTATAAYNVQVADPVKITSSGALPDACLNKPYSFTVQTSGGLPNFQWNLMGDQIGVFFPLNFPDTRVGTLAGTPTALGTFAAHIQVFDLGVSDTQAITLNVVQCP